MTKKIGIMQPYFLPYMGYWQLISCVDAFVIYDNIQYTKKGWITRNRFLLNGRDEIFSLSVKADSDFLDIADRRLADTFDRDKLIRQLEGAYRKAPHFNDNFPLIEEIILCSEQELSAYIGNSIAVICGYLGIRTPLIMSSQVPSDHRSLKGSEKVISICKAQQATEYINPSGGVDLYDRADFAAQGIKLDFLRSRALNYAQFPGHEFQPHLSIVDVLMFNSRDRTAEYLNEFDII